MGSTNSKAARKARRRWLSTLYYHQTLQNSSEVACMNLLDIHGFIKYTDQRIQFGDEAYVFDGID